jgi:hypothetical protein
MNGNTMGYNESLTNMGSFNNDISNMGYIYTLNIIMNGIFIYIYPIWVLSENGIYHGFLYILENHALKTRCNQQELQVPLSTTGLLPYMAPTTLTSILNTYGIPYLDIFGGMNIH